METNKNVSVTENGITITISGQADNEMSLSEVLGVIESALLAWGYRFNGDLDIVNYQGDE